MNWGRKGGLGFRVEVLGLGFGLDWTTDTKDTKWVLKRVLVRIAAFYCARRPQIWIPEILKMQKMVSHVKIGPRTPEIQIGS